MEALAARRYLQDPPDLLMITLLIYLLVLGLVWYVATYIARQIGAPPPVFVILNVLFALVALLWLLQMLGVIDAPFVRLR